MAKVDTNVVRLAYAREPTAGTASGVGARILEPNEITQFGASITTVAREPISDRLQRRKGTPTDLDSTTAFGADITVDGLLDWIEGAIFAEGFNANVRDLVVESTEGTGGSAEFTVVTDLVAAQNAKLKDGALVWGHGFAADDNNGLFRVRSDTSTNDSVEVDDGPESASGGTLTAPLGYITLAGYRVPTSTSKTWTYTASSKSAVLTLTSSVVGELDDILAVGQMVHFGSVASPGAALDNGLFVVGGGNTEGFGFARVKEIGSSSITFDRVSADLQQSGAADTSNALDIIAGDFITNVPRTDSKYTQRAHTIELLSPDLFVGQTISGTMITSASTADAKNGREYAVGQVVGTLTLNFPLTDKATMTVNFVGQDTEKPIQGARATGVAGFGTAQNPGRAEAFNTSADFARLRVLDADDDGVTSDFKSMTLTINPQTSPEKVLNKVGAQFINRGNLLVDVATQVIFTDPGVINAVRDNDTVSFEAVIGNNEGVFVFDIPSMTVGGGGREYPANQAVLVNATGQSFEDADLATSIGVSFMPVPIPTD